MQYIPLGGAKTVLQDGVGATIINELWLSAEFSWGKKASPASGVLN